MSADIYARFQRLKGREVLFVSGSDLHGTPIEVEAMLLGVDPKEYALKMHEIVAELFKRWEISFDNYTHTETETHISFVRNFFTRLYERGYIFEREEEVPYCERDRIYLPDRFIVGKCPYCGYDRARGDQCEACGRLLEPRQLIEPRCAICGSPPTWRRTKHWYLDLKRVEDSVKRYVEQNDALPETAKSMSLSFIREGLRPRAITRDNRWGIPAPFPGAEGKTIYVWFEALLGYISATIEYFERRGDPDGWKRYWMGQDTRVVFFVGKDNIPFHVIILPAMLIASGEPFVMPYSTASTEYLLYEGDKFSKSRRHGIWIDEALKIMDVEYWRFVLIYLRPARRDTDFRWDVALEAVNKVLNDDVGNYIHRVLTLIKRIGGRVPEPGQAVREDEELRDAVLKGIDEAEDAYERAELRKALMSVVEIARAGNRHLNARAPWELIKRDPAGAGTALYYAYWAVKAIVIGLYPVMPRHMAEAWRMMGMDGEPGPWDEARNPPKPGVEVRDPRPLFRKISEEEVRAALARLEEDRKVRWARKYPWEQVVLD